MAFGLVGHLGGFLDCCTSFHWLALSFAMASTQLASCSGLVPGLRFLLWSLFSGTFALLIFLSRCFACFSPFVFPVSSSDSASVWIFPCIGMVGKVLSLPFCSSAQVVGPYSRRLCTLAFLLSLCVFFLVGFSGRSFSFSPCPFFGPFIFFGFRGLPLG